MALLGIHLHSAPADITVSTMMLWLQLMGGTAARLDTNWSDYQGEPQPQSFDARSAGFTEKRLAAYLAKRGYGENGKSLRAPAEAVRQSAAAGLRSVFNFGVIAPWMRAPRSDFQVGEDGDRRWINSLSDPALVGEFLHDFIVYTVRQDGGPAALEKLAGWQIFNEVNGIYGSRDEQLPTDQYFQIGEQALVKVRDAYDAVEWERHSKLPRPPVLLPSVGNPYNGLFLDALFDYRPTDPSVSNRNGQLAIEAIAQHPYGQRVEPWLDPLTDENLGADTKTNLTYHRQLRPTDDLLTWHALVARDPERNAQQGLYLYAADANPGDAYFDRNSETGMEQTMAQLAQNGYGHVRFNFTEFGTMSWTGDSAAGAESLWDTSFASPFLYGYVPPGEVLPKAVAENLQAESVIQLVGLIESWSFVDTANVYEYFDQLAGQYGGEFGLAYGTLDEKGQARLKPSGKAYRAYLSGNEIRLTDIAGADGNMGVDIHLAAAGAKGAFSETRRDASAHELILLRDGDDVLDGGAGDDVVFGGPGADAVSGGEGYDRLYGGSGDDRLVGGAGADKLKGDDGDDTLTGGPGGDHFSFAAYATSGSGFAGHDTVTDFDVREDRLLLVGGYRFGDLFDAKLFPGLVQNEAGGTRITYADNGASIFLAGVERTELGVGNFHILQSDRTVDVAIAAATRQEGTTRSETMTGSRDADRLRGMAGHDDLRGLDGDDILDGGSGADRMEGGPGNDTFVVDAAGDEVIEAIAGGNDRIVARVSIPALPDNVEDLLLDSSKAIDGTGNELANVLNGNSNRNVLRGGGGNDVILGSGGRDTLMGGEGDDRLTGGTGNDLFVASAGTDVIEDFSHGDVVKVALNDFGEIEDAAVQDGADTVIALGRNDKLVLRNVPRDSLKPEDFQFQ